MLCRDLVFHRGCIYGAATEEEETMIVLEDQVCANCLWWKGGRCHLAPKAISKKADDFCSWFRSRREHDDLERARIKFLEDQEAGKIRIPRPISALEDE
jgi:hypothetical protein